MKSLADDSEIEELHQLFYFSSFLSRPHKNLELQYPQWDCLKATAAVYLLLVWSRRQEGEKWNPLIKQGELLLFFFLSLPFVQTAGDGLFEEFMSG